MENLLTLSEAAGRMGRSEHTLRHWKQNGGGPDNFKVGRRVMYRPEVVDQWLVDQEAATSSNSSARQDAK